MRLFSRPEKTITISTETIIKGIAFTIGAYLLLAFIGNVVHELRLIIVSAFLALALNPAVNWITVRLKSKSRVRATGVAYIMVLTLLISFLALVVPPLFKQTSDFIKEVPATINDLKTGDSAVANAVRRYNLEEQVDKLRDDFSGRIGDLGGPVFSTAGRIGGMLVSIITVLVLAFMMLIEGPHWFERFMALQPVDKRAHRKQLVKRMYGVVTGYVNGQVFIAGIAAAFALVALLIGGAVFNTSVNAVALAGIIFMFGLIPMFGNILGAIIVVLVCLLSSTSLALVMLVFFLIYQQVENATLQPYVQSRSNQLTPLIVFIAALLGVGIGGILGALVAIPIAGCLRIIAEDRLNSRFPSLQSLDDHTTKKD